jgi:hypothetical protein
MNVTKVDVSEEEDLRKSGALPPGYVPEGEIGWQLVRLRAKSIASGAKRLNDRELEEKISQLRD